MFCLPNICNVFSDFSEDFGYQTLLHFRECFVKATLFFSSDIKIYYENNR